LRRHGLDEGQIETAVGVIAMFNYFTRVADATGIEFDYPTPLPAFEPDVCQVAAGRPARPGEAGRSEARPDTGGRPVPAAERLRTLWDAWRSCLLEADEPLSTGQRCLVAAIAAEESGDWAGAAELSGRALPGSAGDALPGFARKLSPRAVDHVRRRSRCPAQGRPPNRPPFTSWLSSPTRAPIPALPQACAPPGAADRQPDPLAGRHLPAGGRRRRLPQASPPLRALDRTRDVKLRRSRMSSAGRSIAAK
jgi:hypothetical protein